MLLRSMMLVWFRYRRVAANSPETSISPMFVVEGIKFMRTPAGGINPVAPAWLVSGVRSMYQSISPGCTPNSCCSTPRAQIAAVC